MPQQQTVSDPFALMMNPEAVFQAMHRSDRLKQLTRRVCRPLDRPLIARVAPDPDELEQELDTMPGTDDIYNDFESLSGPMELGDAIHVMRDPDEA